jgi:two-component system cell cycle sensor histidine kinase/response regulator CckA
MTLQRGTLGGAGAAGAQQGHPPQSVMVDLPQHQRAPTAHQPWEVACQHRQRLESLGVVAGEIAHDCNTLLAVILSSTHLALAEVPPHSGLWQHLHHILSAGRRAHELMRQLLMWSAQSPQERTPLSLHEVIAEAVTLLQMSLPSTIALRHHIAPDAGVIRADATQIQQVVLNLCTNAVQAMRNQGGSMEVTWEAVESSAPSGAHARLTVRDTGPGIAPAILDRIFEPFFTTKAMGEGTGMGLAIVQRIVARHGGVIRVASTVGQGTTVEIDLPRLERGGTRAAVVAQENAHSN